jgi:hypothetical protein
MGIQSQWDADEPDILLFDLRSQWTWDEFHVAAQRLVGMISSVPYPVYVITLSATSFPVSPSVLGEFHKVSRIIPPTVALIVVVTDNFLIETVNEVFFRVSPLARRVGRLAKTLDSARQLIAAHRAKRDVG